MEFACDANFRVGLRDPSHHVDRAPRLAREQTWVAHIESSKQYIVRRSLVAPNDVRALLLDAQAIFRRRRHQPRRPPIANSRPGSPAPTLGMGAVLIASISPRADDNHSALATKRP